MKLRDLKIGEIYFYSKKYFNKSMFFIKNIEVINRKINLTTIWIDFSFRDITVIKNSSGSYDIVGNPAPLQSSEKIDKKRAIIIIFSESI